MAKHRTWLYGTKLNKRQTVLQWKRLFYHLCRKIGRKLAYFGESFFHLCSEIERKLANFGESSFHVPVCGMRKSKRGILCGNTGETHDLL